MADRSVLERGAGIGLRGLTREAVAGAMLRPGRTLITVLAVVLGTGALVASLGVTASGSRAVAMRFDELQATEVVLRPPDTDTRLQFPPNAGERLAEVEGVVAGGPLWEVQPDGAPPPITSAFSPDTTAASPPLFAASGHTLRALRPHLRHGRLFHVLGDEKAARVAVLGREAASSLGIGRLGAGAWMSIGGYRFAVVDVLDDVGRRPEVLTAVIVPDTTARSLWADTAARSEVLIDVEPGYAAVVGRQSPAVLRPDDPDVFTAIVPPDPRMLRTDVVQDVSGVHIAMGVLVLLVGALVIGNALLVGVIERTSEIGLRRALGATRSEIAGQFLIEAAQIGLTGGILGAAAGVTLVSAIATIRGWPLTIAPAWLLAAPGVGIAAGIAAGTYPALRAARIEPADAVRAQ